MHLSDTVFLTIVLGVKDPCEAISGPWHHVACTVSLPCSWSRMHWRVFIALLNRFSRLSWSRGCAFFYGAGARIDWPDGANRVSPLGASYLGFRWIFKGPTWRCTTFFFFGLPYLIQILPSRDLGCEGKCWVDRLQDGRSFAQKIEDEAKHRNSLMRAFLVNSAERFSGHQVM